MSKFDALVCLLLSIISFFSCIFLSALAKNDIAVGGIVQDKKIYIIKAITLTLLSFFYF
ncbi:hypothetical protein Bint_2603 [Brachyspira intermedia PWS/A]|uniref:Uncharacterized protein n=1 Tax=Brachyspira intermedia (strain ATCC 51140 / PWS/A) TaxID=1045858 RepID=G0EPD7_BRAIP|nr:hypothetical protein Bint_2603 [Brachyspira intermedia PWS/A]